MNKIVIGVVVVIFLLVGGIIAGFAQNILFWGVTKSVVKPKLPQFLYTLRLQNETGHFLDGRAFAYTGDLLKGNVSVVSNAPNAFVLDQNFTYWWVLESEGYYHQKHGLFAAIGDANVSNCKHQGVDFFCSEHLMVLHKFPVDLGVELRPALSKGFDSYVLSLNTSHELRRPLLCFKWSYDIQMVRVPNVRVVSAPLRLHKEFFDACYAVGSVYREKKDFVLEIVHVKTPIGSPDVVKMWIIDQDTVFNPLTSDWIFSAESGGFDNAFKDVVITITEKNVSVE